MKKKLGCLVVTVLTISLLSAQETKKSVKPIGIDRSTLSGVGLKKIDLKDEPEKDFYQKNVFWGNELGVFVVGTETWINTITNYPFDEFIYMYNGEAIVKPHNGASQIFYSGDYFFAPKGYRGEWEVKGNNQIHYELSVITTKRADSAKIITGAKHRLFEKATLTGNSMDLDKEGYDEKILEKGAELTVKLIGEKLGERPLSMTTREQFIHVLSGQIKIADAAAKEYTFYSGDFFVLPKGLTGTWSTNGHNLVKYFVVEKTTHM